MSSKAIAVILCVAVAFVQIQQIETADLSEMVFNLLTMENIFKAGEILGKFISSDAATRKTDDLIRDTQSLIVSSKEEIINVVQYHHKIAYIDDAELSFDALFSQLQSITTAKTTTDTRSYTNTFLNSYVIGSIDTTLFNLPIRLTHKSAGGDKASLLDIVTKQVKCNLNELKSFRNYFVNVVGKGLYLKSAYLVLSGKMTATLKEDERKIWDAKISGMYDAFDKNEVAFYEKCNISNHASHRDGRTMLVWTLIVLNMLIFL